MTELVQLKPCPFCNARPHRGLGKVEHCQLHGEPLQRFSIWCPHGHARVTAPSEAIARGQWNTRAPDPRITQLEADNAALLGKVERLEKALRFYANGLNWLPYRQDGIDYPPSARKDNGATARQALGDNT